MFQLLALLCFLVAAICFLVTKSWTLALVAAGLALWILTDYPFGLDLNQ